MLRLEVIGNVGQDAKINEVNGKKVINFSLAHNEKFKNADGVKQERTTWVNCAIWRNDGNTALAPYLASGSKVFVSGTPETRSYQDSNGTWQSELKLNVQRVDLISSNFEKVES